MARTTAIKAPTKKRGRRGAGNGGILTTFLVIVITLCGVTAPPLAVLLVVGMLPTGAVALIDRHPAHYLVRTVGAMNLAGIVPAALKLWEAGITFAAFRELITSPYTWLVMYGVAAIGWVLHFSVPPVVRILIDLRAEEAKRRLEARAKMLIEEWGEEVSGRPRESK